MNAPHARTVPGIWPGKNYTPRAFWVGAEASWTMVLVR